MHACVLNSLASQPSQNREHKVQGQTLSQGIEWRTRKMIRVFFWSSHWRVHLYTYMLTETYIIYAAYTTFPQHRHAPPAHAQAYRNIYPICRIHHIPPTRANPPAHTCTQKHHLTDSSVRAGARNEMVLLLEEPSEQRWREMSFNL